MSTESSGKIGGHKTLAVKLSPELHAQLSLISGLDGLSMGAALLRAVEVYVDTRRNQPDFAERAATAVAEAEAEAAARRNAIQALLGQAASSPTVGSEAEPVASDGQAPPAHADDSGAAGTEPATNPVASGTGRPAGGKRGRGGEGASA